MKNLTTCFDGKSDESYKKVIELEHALEYVSKHFIYHADQRIKTLRYFMLYLGVIIVGFYNVHDHGDFGTLTFLTILSLLVTLIFGLIEWRNNELVNNAKTACISLEEILFCELNENFKNSSINNISDLLASIQVVKLSNKNKNKLNKLISYRICLPLFYAVVILSHFVLLSVSLFCLYKGICKT